MIKNYTFLKYGKLNYNEVNINPDIIEISCTFNNFNKQKKILEMPYSLHTEYSASIIKNPVLKKIYPILFQSKYNNKASLWTSQEWLKEFIDLIQKCINNIGKLPKIIEIHPPYKTEVDLNNFFNLYSLFENAIKKLDNNIIILIENRNCCGNFLFSTIDDYKTFVKNIEERNLNLKLIIDIPQLFGKEIYRKKPKSEKDYQKLIDNIFNTLYSENIHSYIQGLHICGKGHKGDLSSIFNNNSKITNYFLKKFSEFSNNLNNHIYIVPEIFSQKDFVTIISDLKKFKII